MFIWFFRSIYFNLLCPFDYSQLIFNFTVLDFFYSDIVVRNSSSSSTRQFQEILYFHQKKLYIYKKKLVVLLCVRDNDSQNASHLYFQLCCYYYSERFCRMRVCFVMFFARVPYTMTTTTVANITSGSRSLMFARANPYRIHFIVCLCLCVCFVYGN